MAKGKSPKDWKSRHGTPGGILSSSEFGGWERLLCDYFPKICRRSLGGWASGEQFVEKRVTTIGGIVYVRGKTYLEFSYEPETCPDYFLKVELGIGDGGRYGLPMWYLIQGAPARKYSTQTFRTEEELDRVLRQFVEHVVEPYAKPLWMDLAVLESTIAKINRSVGL